jgi:hypothetical protein
MLLSMSTVRALLFFRGLTRKTEQYSSIGLPDATRDSVKRA